MKMGVL